MKQNRTAKTKAPKELSARDMNRLQIDQQILKIRLIENALTYRFNGKSKLFGNLVDETTLSQAKLDLVELDRLQQIYDGDKYEKLPYFSSNGSRVDSVKDHYDKDDGSLAFIEVKQMSSGKFVVNHKHSKSFIKKQIKQKQMATKAKTKAATKKGTKKVTKTQGDSIKSRVDKLVAAGKDNAAIFEALDKAGIKYSENSVRWYASKARAL